MPTVIKTVIWCLVAAMVIGIVNLGINLPALVELANLDEGVRLVIISTVIVTFTMFPLFAWRFARRGNVSRIIYCLMLLVGLAIQPPTTTGLQFMNMALQIGVGVLLWMPAANRWFRGEEIPT